MLVAVRVIHLFQAGLTAVAGSYRHRLLDYTMVGVAVLESAWVLERLRRHPVTDRMAGIVDVGFGAILLVAVGLATSAFDRSAWVNWACPYTYGSTAMALMVFRRRISGAITGGLVAIYLATVYASLAAGGSLLATSAANAVTYIGVWVGAGVVVDLLRRSARETSEASCQAVERGARLATEQERNRQRRLIHDSALQTLEALSSSLYGVDEGLRRQAGAEASRLRQALRCSAETPASLPSGLGCIVYDTARLGVRVDLVVTAEHFGATDEQVEALTEASREALMNVVKHAGVRRAVLSAHQDEECVEVVVRDHGVGFDTARATFGLGLRHSIIERLGDVGGSADVWSEMGRGTCVTLRVTVRAAT